MSSPIDSTVAELRALIENMVTATQPSHVRRRQIADVMHERLDAIENAQRPLIEWARRVYWETGDLGRCRYYLGIGSCSGGASCTSPDVMEPQCQTCIGDIDTLDEPDDEGDVPQIRGWLSDLLDPMWVPTIFPTNNTTPGATP